ncbi:ACT domain-containing protein [Actinomadura darangshiensis]|uniref:ACT domain-containing protein n=1 Tax=Actinomadura darangshiensis TaxID=705336 RepID=A0A4R5BMW6_9ACTN|nr:ACT domain-containing protein [Actinomadura darangshiensis]TDD88161.1 ACT domain-containing protein [Actinomadura darangshiensis]
MLLRVRVRLPDRPGSLGRVARTLGAAGADVVQMAVLERGNGRAMDDFTVAWPSGAGVDRLAEGLGSVPGVEVAGIWPTAEPQGGCPDAAVIGQVAAVPERGARILADAVPAILSADWAGLAEPAGEDAAVVVHASVGGRAGAAVAGLLPLRPRAFTAPDGTEFAVCPLAKGSVALVVARTGAPPFHRTEVSRLEQLAGAADAVLLGDRSSG